MMHPLPQAMALNPYWNWIEFYEDGLFVRAVELGCVPRLVAGEWHCLCAAGVHSKRGETRLDAETLNAAGVKV